MEGQWFLLVEFTLQWHVLAERNGQGAAVMLPFLYLFSILHRLLTFFLDCDSAAAYGN